MKIKSFYAIVGLSLSIFALPQESLAEDVNYLADQLPQDSNPFWLKNISIHADPISGDSETITSGILNISATIEHDRLPERVCFDCHMPVSPHHILPDADPWIVSYEIEDNNICHSAGTRLEARIKIEPGSRSLGLEISDGSFRETVLIADNEMKLFERNYMDNPAPGHRQSFTDDFHLIRVDLKDGILQVFVDENLVISSTNLHPSTDKKIKFGTHTHSLDASIDYIKYSSLGDENTVCINNIPPIANAGENRQLSSEQMGSHALIGEVTDDNEYDHLQCRWLHDAVPLHDWRPVAANGQCILLTEEIGLPVGTHTMTLEAFDGLASSSDSMILSIDNAAPHIALTGSGVYQYGTTISINGAVSDFDGDPVIYIIADDEFGQYCDGILNTHIGGAPVNIPECVFEGLSVGHHMFQALAYDGVNEANVTAFDVFIVDNTAPTLAPVANKTILWPANHELVDIQIIANARDDSGLPVMLTASVRSDEAISGLGSGDTAPDWSPITINQDTGEISLQLRAERSGSGDGRTYEVTIVAHDAAGNNSTATVQIIVPHNKRVK